MQKIKKRWKAVLLSSFVLVLAVCLPARANTNATPTVLEVNTSSSYAIDAPVFSGVTPKDTNVLVFVDDVFAGSAVVKDSGTASDSFYFHAKGYKQGEHSVYFVSEDKETLERSKKSKYHYFSVAGLPAPTLVVPNPETITGKVKPLIEGFSRTGSFVHIYIDGVYNGKTAVVTDESGTAHFAYTPFLNLAVGPHKMWAKAEDVHGRKSEVSKVVEFNIEDQLPAPTMFEPVLNKHTDYNRPFIVGLAKNDSVIKVFVDHKLYGKFEAGKHESGTVDFAYMPETPLKDGEHLVYTSAVDERGKESRWSNVIYFDVLDPKTRQSEISDRAVSEEDGGGVNQDNADSIDETNGDEESTSKEDEKKALVNDYLVFATLYESDNSIRLTDGQYDELELILNNPSDYELNNSQRENLENLLASKDVEIDTEDVKDASETAEQLDVEDVLKQDQQEDEEGQAGGPIDEDKNSQRSLGWNALVFTLFLLAVIAWIFWVNRELIKEKAEQESKGGEKKK